MNIEWMIHIVELTYSLHTDWTKQIFGPWTSHMTNLQLIYYTTPASWKWFDENYCICDAITLSLVQSLQEVLI